MFNGLTMTLTLAVCEKGNRMRILCILFTSLCVCSVGFGQQPIERTTIVEKFAAPAQCRQCQSPAVRYVEVPTVRYAVPVTYAAPVVLAPVPVAVPVGYRVGVFGFRQEVIYSDGSRVRYRR